MVWNNPIITHDINKYGRNTRLTRKPIMRDSRTKIVHRATAEGKTIILRGKSTEIRFDKKMVNKGGK